MCTFVKSIAIIFTILTISLGAFAEGGGVTGGSEPSSDVVNKANLDSTLSQVKDILPFAINFLYFDWAVVANHTIVDGVKKPGRGQYYKDLEAFFHGPDWDNFHVFEMLRSKKIKAELEPHCFNLNGKEVVSSIVVKENGKFVLSDHHICLNRTMLNKITNRGDAFGEMLGYTAHELLHLAAPAEDNEFSAIRIHDSIVKAGFRPELAWVGLEIDQFEQEANTAFQNISKIEQTADSASQCRLFMITVAQTSFLLHPDHNVLKGMKYFGPKVHWAYYQSITGLAGMIPYCFDEGQTDDASVNALIRLANQTQQVKGRDLPLPDADNPIDVRFGSETIPLARKDNRTELHAVIERSIKYYQEAIAELDRMKAKIPKN